VSTGGAPTRIPFAILGVESPQEVKKIDAVEKRWNQQKQVARRDRKDAMIYVEAFNVLKSRLNCDVVRGRCDGVAMRLSFLSRAAPVLKLEVVDLSVRDSGQCEVNNDGEKNSRPRERADILNTASTNLVQHCAGCCHHGVGPVLYSMRPWIANQKHVMVHRRPIIAILSSATAGT
jgi:hypothetical protein